MSRIRQPASRTLLLILRASTGIFRTDSCHRRDGRHSIPRRLRPLGARVRLNSLFKLLSFSGDAERDSLKSLSQVGFTLRGYADFILAGM